MPAQKIQVNDNTPAAKDTVYYMKHRVENLYAPVDDKNPTATPTVFFFNLTAHKHVAAAFAKTTDKWFRETPHMYFTFEYVIVPKSSTKFEIK